MPDQYCASSGKHEEWAQVSNLTQLWLPPALPWGGDIPLVVPRVLRRPEFPPKSMSPAIAAAAFYHADWSFVGGLFCHVHRKKRTKAQRVVNT